MASRGLTAHYFFTFGCARRGTCMQAARRSRAGTAALALQPVARIVAILLRATCAAARTLTIGIALPQRAAAHAGFSGAFPHCPASGNGGPTSASLLRPRPPPLPGSTCSWSATRPTRASSSAYCTWTPPPRRCSLCRRARSRCSCASMQSTRWAARNARLDLPAYQEAGSCSVLTAQRTLSVRAVHKHPAAPTLAPCPIPPTCPSHP